MLLLAFSLAAADPLFQADRPVLPFRSLAGEDGVHVLFENPSLMAYDRDAMYGLFYDYNDTNLQSLSFAATAGGLGAGVGFREINGASWWTVSTGLGIHLNPTLSAGTALHWQLPDGGDNNFLSWDLGLGWRPFPFVGFGGSVQNLGNPAPDLGVFTRYGAGVALRPANDFLTLGVDWNATAPSDSPWDHHLVGSARIRPIKGLWLRAFVDKGLTDTSYTEVGGAVEIHVAEFGVGAQAHTDLGGNGMAGGGYITTTPSDDQLIDPGQTVAEFDFSGALPYIPQPGSGQESYLSMLRRMDAASKDPQVRGLLLHLDSVGLSYAQVEEIRALLKTARDNRKPVVAFLGEDASTRAYYLATGCDRVYMHPAASLDLIGMSAEIQYYKGAMDLVGIRAQYAKRAEFKSAPEAYTNETASAPAREEMDALLDDIFGEIVQGIATGRGKTPEDIRTIIDGGPYTGQEAVDKGLIDGLVYPDELDETLSDIFPSHFDRDEEYQRDPDTSGWAAQRAVAVIIVDGAINSGPSSPGGFLSGASTGSETVVQQLAQARRSPGVKAVVLRVDSPGGSAFASDEIWREVERVKEAGKPVIVSMGSYAASGGYYVSAGADAIVALPSTVTGSIGVYGGKYSGEELLDTLHIHTDTWLRGRNADMFTMTRPFDDIEFAALDRMIGETYRQFKDRVATGRGLSMDQVEEVARGHVWSGSDAKERGLVDEMGGFFDAVDLARAQAGLSSSASYALITYNPWMGSRNFIPAYLIHMLGPQVDLPPAIQHLAELSALKDEHVYAMMPYYLEIQ